jgi:hypothetical protein
MQYFLCKSLCGRFLLRAEEPTNYIRQRNNLLYVSPVSVAVNYTVIFAVSNTVGVFLSGGETKNNYRVI